LKKYEALILISSRDASRDPDGVVKHTRNILEKAGADISELSKWEDRRLAYEIKGVRRGTYYLAYFEADPTSIDRIRRACRMSETILRILVVKDERKPEPDAAELPSTETQPEAAGPDETPEDAGGAVESSEPADASVGTPVSGSGGREDQPVSEPEKPAP